MLDLLPLWLGKRHLHPVRLDLFRERVAVRLLGLLGYCLSEGRNEEWKDVADIGGGI